jgi:hypothetical protein
MIVVFLFACAEATLEGTDTSVDTDVVDTDAPAGPDHVVLNEVLASNKTGLTDEAGDFDDWIELYNPTVANVPLDEWSLIGNDGDSWKFPDGTVIPAGAWLVIWCDDQDDGPLHASFKLSSDGDVVALENGDDVRVDATTFLGQEQDVSWARMPEDGAATWGAMNPPTPGAPNAP